MRRRRIAAAGVLVLARGCRRRRAPPVRDGGAGLRDAGREEARQEATTSGPLTAFADCPALAGNLRAQAVRAAEREASWRYRSPDYVHAPRTNKPYTPVVATDPGGREGPGYAPRGSRTRLLVLAERGGGLAVRAELPRLADVRHVHSVRRLGDIAYLMPCRKPPIAVDLYDPEKPRRIATGSFPGRSST